MGKATSPMIPKSVSYLRLWSSFSSLDKVWPSHNLATAKITMAIINVNKSHWILYFFDQKKIVYFLDPLVPSFLDYMSLNEARKLHKVLLATMKSHKLLWIAFQSKNTIKKDTQKNSFDCGPLCCGYAWALAKTLTLTKINIAYIRQWVYTNAPEPMMISTAHWF